MATFLPCGGYELCSLSCERKADLRPSLTPCLPDGAGTSMSKASAILTARLWSTSLKSSRMRVRTVRSEQRPNSNCAAAMKWALRRQRGRARTSALLDVAQRVVEEARLREVVVAELVRVGPLAQAADRQLDVLERQRAVLLVRARGLRRREAVYEVSASNATICALG